MKKRVAKPRSRVRRRPATIDPKLVVAHLQENAFLYLQDTSGRITYVSPSIRDVLGYSPRHLKAHFSKTLTDHPLNQEAIRRSEAGMRGEKQPPFLVEVHHADGSRRWFELNETPLTNRRGKVVAVQGIAMDVTRRARAEEEQRKQERRLNLVMEAVGLAAWEWDLLADRITYSASAATIAGGEDLEDYATVENLLHLAHPDDREALARAVERTTSSGAPYHCEYRVLMQDGRYHWIMGDGRVEEWDDERPTRAFGISLDISHSRQAEQERLENLQRYQLLFHGSRDAILLADVETGRIVDANAEALRLFDRSFEGLIGLSQHELHPPEERERYQELFRLHVEERLADPVEIEIVRPDGSRVPVELRSRLIDLAGHGRINYGIFRDITDWKRASVERQRLLEQEREARVEAENALRDRDRFLMIAAHELKTPLAALNIQIEGMGKWMAEGKANPEMFGDGVAIAQRQAYRLIHLVEGLLDLARIRSGRFDLARRPTDIVRLVRGVLQRLQPSIDQAACTVALSGSESLAGSWDPDRIEQVVENLLGNAMKFGRGGLIEIHVTDGDGMARLEVRDHGVGISKDKLEQIFEPYERGDSPLHHGGLGMGLFIVREIVAAHGGRIEAESVPDEGSRFTVTLPLS